MRQHQIGLSLMPEDDYLAAVEPLFNANEVDVIEWSFDMCWGRELPQRCFELLTQYAQVNALYGHGVSFSLLTGRRTRRQEIWLQYLAKEVSRFKYQKISEHFGFFATDQFLQAAPLSMPCNDATLAVGTENLNAIKQIAQVPVGLENLGFAFSKEDVIEQGKLLTAILDAVDGFLLLDIHNIYCHMLNFDLSFEEVCHTLPLARATEMHISGGRTRKISYEQKNIYCDSHDAAVPRELFDILEKNLHLFPKVETIIYERLGNTITCQADQHQVRDDFFTLKSILNKLNT